MQATQAQLLGKVHTSAVVILPPQHSWKAIQAVRRKYDSNFFRWPPHINLLYPFHGRDLFDECAARMCQVLKSVEPFEITLKEFAILEHRNSCTLVLKPKDAVVEDFQSKLFKEFPECDDLNHDPSRGISSFLPHLSLGGWRNLHEAEAVRDQLENSWDPVEFRLTKVHLLSRQGFREPFRSIRAVSLGTESTVVCENEKYVCENGMLTVGDEPVWNFAYGANMSSDKLIKVRGINYMQAYPAVLRDHVLKFNHKGGMGNVEPCSPDAKGQVHGILYKLESEDFEKLRSMECDYRGEVVECEPYDSSVGKIKAVCFQSPKDKCIRDNLPPPTRYLKLLQNGAREWNLSSEYSNWLDSHPSVESGDRSPEYWLTPDGQKTRTNVLQKNKFNKRRRPR